MIVDTDILFKAINNTLAELNKTPMREYDQEVENKIRYYRELKSGLIRLETFAAIEKLEYIVVE